MPIKAHRRIAEAAISALILVFVITTNGEAQTPRNGKIAFTSDRDGNREIYLMNPDGSDQTRLTNNSLVDDVPKWSPDGTKLAFVRQKIAGGFSIFIMHSHSGSIVEVTPVGNDGYPWYSYMSWSPDGDRIAFADQIASNNSDVFVVNIDGSNRQNITNDSVYSGNPAWSPDGSKILFTGTATGYAWLYSINPNGSALQPLPIGLADGFGDDQAAWSPFGDRIAFVVNRWDFWSAIFTSNADGTNRQLFDECNCNADRYHPAWSPDGQTLSYVITTSFQTPNGWDYDAEIFRKHLDGTGFVQLTSTNGRSMSPSWQPLDLAVSISGRVTTSNGRGLGNTVVSMIDSLGVRRTATTSTFGYYSFNSVPGDTYTTSVRSKRHKFKPLTIFAGENLFGIDFISMN